MKSTLQGLIFIAAIAVLTACTSSDAIDFENMSAIELAEYNRPLNLGDKVYCVDEIRTGSHIRRRHCDTLLELQRQLEKSVSEVTVLSTTRLF